MVWQCGELELDETRFELRRAGRRVVIAPKPLAVLLHLARRRPAAVSRDELLRVLWPGAKVTDASLSRAIRAARVALGESADDPSGSIRTVRGRGYLLASADGVASTSWRAKDETVPQMHPFVGRTRDLARLEGSLDLLHAGRGCLVRVCGEVGIGKSRLLEELAIRARARGCAAVLDGCREGEGVPPLWPWPEIARRLHEEDAVARPCVGGVASAACDLSRELDTRHGAIHSVPGVGAAVRFRLFQDVATLLRRACATRPLVLLIDDLHWGSEVALGLLRFVARSLRDAPCMLVLSYCLSALEGDSSAGAALGDLANLSNALPEIRLAGFSRAEAHAYVTATMGRQPSRRLAQLLDAETGGNPRLLRELVPLLLYDEPKRRKLGLAPVPRRQAASTHARAAIKRHVHAKTSPCQA